MMIYPPITELMKKVDSRYTLVIQTAKRARQIAEEDASLIAGSDKAVTIAINEIYDGKVDYIKAKA